MNRRRFLSAVAAAASSRRGAAAAPRFDLHDKLVAVHAMVELPEWAADVGRNWDAKAFVRACREAGVQIIEQKSKNAMGHATFRFKNRPCEADWVTGTRNLARDAGMPYVAYYNVGLDNWMARERPEWRCVDPAGKPQIAFGAFNWMCLRSPWRDVVLAEVREVAEALRPEAFWFDLLGAPNAYGTGSFDPARACFCPHCRQAWRAAYGGEQPEKSDDPDIRAKAFRLGHQSRIGMLRDLFRMLKSIDSRMVLGYNGAGFYDALGGTPEEIRELTGLHSSEAKSHRLISFKAKSMWAMGKPYQIHSYNGVMRMQPGDAVGTWTAWNLIPAGYMQVSAAIATAHAGRISVGVNPLPDGTVRLDELRNLAFPFKAVREREQWLAGLESVPSLAVVYDAESELALLPSAARGAMRVQQEATGLHHALLDAGMHFDVVDASRVDPGKYAALLVADAVAGPPALLDKLRRHVERGGLAIVTNETSLLDAAGKRRPDFAWAELLGVRFRGLSPFEEANFCWAGEELRGDGPDYPALFLTRVLEVECTTARPLAELVYPEDRRTPERFTDGETPYNHFKTRTGKPLVSINRVGKGSVVYIAGPIGREIALRDDPWLKRIVTAAVRKFAPPRALEMEAPAGIQAVFGRKDKGATHVLSLVNVYGGLVGQAGPPKHPQVGPVSVVIPLSVFPRRPALVRPIGAQGVEWKVAGDSLKVQVASVGHHALLVIT